MDERTEAIRMLQLAAAKNFEEIVARWTRYTNGFGQTAYRSGAFVIEPRFRSGYLGGGRRMSAKIYLLLRNGVPETRPFTTLHEAKTHAALAKFRGRS